MKAVFIRAHGEIKVGDQKEVTAAEFATLADEGYVITASEWKAQEAVKASDARVLKAREAVIDKAIITAKEAGKFLAKEDTDEIRATALAIESGREGAGVAFIANQPVKDKDLLSRQTAPVMASGASVGQESLERVSLAVVKATEPQDKLIRSGRFTEAAGLSKEASLLLQQNHMRIGASDSFMLRDMVKAATFTDPNSQVGSLAGDMVILKNLGYLKNKLPWMGRLTTDLSSQPCQFGQSILTRYITVPGVVTWVPGVGFTSDAQTISDHSAGTTQSGATLSGTAVVRTPSVPSTTDVPVTLNMFKAVEIDFPVSTLAGTTRNLFGEQIGAQTYGLAEAINKDVLDGIFAATWTGAVTSYVKSLANFTIGSLVELKSFLSIGKVPDIGRFALLHTFYHDKLLQDTNLLNAKAILALLNKDASAFESADVPSMFGIKPLESQLSSATSAGVLTSWSDPNTLGTTNIVGFAGNASSWVFVARPPQDWTGTLNNLGIPATASIRLVTEPDSGLTVMVFSYATNGNMTITQRVCLMWGNAQGDPRVGFPIKVA